MSDCPVRYNPKFDRPDPTVPSILFLLFFVRLNPQKVVRLFKWRRPIVTPMVRPRRVDTIPSSTAPTPRYPPSTLYPSSPINPLSFPFLLHYAQLHESGPMVQVERSNCPTFGEASSCGPRTERLRIRDSRHMFGQDWKGDFGAYRFQTETELVLLRIRGL